MWDLREWQLEDIEQFCMIWNEIIESGNYYTGEEKLDQAMMQSMCERQTAVRCLVNEEGIVGGFYILHPNQTGRGAHVANATYAVSKAFRASGLGRRLVEDSINKAKEKGFRGFQFNAVVSTNTVAINLYEKLGFHLVGTVPQAFRLKSGEYTGLCIMYRSLEAEAGLERIK